MRSGKIQEAINRYKYDGNRGWAIIFARVLVGYLDGHWDVFEDFDLIIASPTFVSDEGDARRWDHTRLVLQKAHAFSEGAWPFDLGDPAALVKTQQTQPMMGKTWKQRKETAETELRDSLQIPDPDKITDKDILIYDDVFTDGFTLREIARTLIGDADAHSVSGITLARQPFWRK